MLNSRLLASLILIVLWVGGASAQSILEELLPENNGGVLRDPGYSNSVPYEVIEVEPPLSDVAQSANLRALDRINGTTTDLTVNVGDIVEYQRLIVNVHECRYPQGDINADAFAQLTIIDTRENEISFEGWMFASSPALSALDHPRYDVWVLSCNNS